jgi:adenylylsulfate kinase
VKKADNIKWHSGNVSYDDRCRLLNQKGLVLWFTGLSGSGKSTIAVELERQLHLQGRLTYLLDGDNVRHGLNSDLGFSAEERDENIRRISEVAVLFRDAGVITLVSFISPFRKMRQFARERIGNPYFLEVYIKADLDTCAERDPKGLYAKAKNGEIKDFTGIHSPYEKPLNPEITIDTTNIPVEDSVQQIIDYLDKL